MSKVKKRFPPDHIFATLQREIDALEPDATRDLLQWDFDLIVAVIAALPYRIEAAAKLERAVADKHAEALRKLHQAMCDGFRPPKR